jgi:mono/diheme cytochrome c family protein
MLLCAAALVAVAAPAAAEESGRDLARQYCAACHRVSAEQAAPPNVVVETGTGPEEYAAPSFRRIAARAERSADRLREKIEAPHYPMREQQFVPEELEAIVAYILSLSAGNVDW